MEAPSPMSTRSYRNSLVRQPIGSPRDSPRKRSQSAGHRIRSVDSPPNEEFRTSSPNNDAGSRCPAETPQVSVISPRIKSTSPKKLSSSKRKQKQREEFNRTASDDERENTQSESEDDQPSGHVKFIHRSKVETGPELLEVSSPSGGLSDSQWYLVIFVVFIAGTFFIFGQPIQQFMVHRRNILFARQHQPTVEDWGAKLSDFLAKLESLRSDFPQQDSKMWLAVRSGVRQAMSDKARQPAVVLLLGPDRTTSDCLARRIAQIVSEVIERTPTTDRIEGAHIAGAADPKMALHDSMNRLLARSSAVAVLNVDAIPGKAAMSLHAFCDNDNAPYKNAAIVLTVMANATAKSNPEEVAEAVLNEAWAKELGEDKVSALISRVAVSVGIVEKENHVTC